MIDSWLLKVLETFDRSDPCDTTALIVGTDHGDYVGDHDDFGTPPVQVMDTLRHMFVFIHVLEILEGGASTRRAVARNAGRHRGPTRTTHPAGTPMTNTPRGDGLVSHVRDIPDFPTPGVGFKDLTPLFADPEAFRATIDRLCEHFESSAIDRVVGVEARGFIIAAPIALQLGAGFVPVRKAGKLPWHALREEYSLEYGTDVLEVHRDAIRPGERVLVIDDVLATGGTAAATARLVTELGGDLMGYGFVVELAFLGGRSKLGTTPAHSLIVYD